MGTSRGDRFVSNVKNEFLRFNDLKPGTSPIAYWSLLLTYAIGLLVLLLLNNLVPTNFGLISELPGALFLAALAFLLIPASALALRRISETHFAQRLLDRISNFQTRNLLGAKLIRALAWILLGLLVFVCLVWINPWLTLAAILILTAIPAAGAKVDLPRATLPNQPPTPPSGPSAQRPPSLPTLNNSAVAAAPPQTLGAPTAQARLRAGLPKPSKPLFSRVGFWLSVALALLIVLFYLFPSMAQRIDIPTLDFEPTATVSESPAAAPTETPPASPEPTPSETPTPSASPTATPTETPPLDASVSGSVDTQSDDDDLVVVPAPGVDESDADLLDPRFRFCTHAIAAGYGPYVYGVDPEYAWYNDRDRDGIVCER